ncbi:MAG TPA: hypothetical protein VJ898_11110 [Natrialbaceae archaeon]|nr:hypothetical protein [Natrialbaceae archaeon]
MATETADERRQHVRAVTVTALAALFGVGAAFVSAFLTSDLSATEAAKNQTAQLVVVAAILVQIPIVQQSGFYDSDEFGAKLVLFIAFMTFSMWFVTWGILLQTGWTF